jgi:hypothetical protein
MAATKKSLEIKRQKQEAASELSEVGKQIVEACGKIPKSVLEGSSQLAVAWRTKAEDNYHKPFVMPGSVTLQAAQDRVTEAKKTLSFLQNPTV